MGRYREPYTIYKRGNYWYYRTYDFNGVRTTPKSTGKRLKSEARAYCEELYKTGKLLNSSKKFGIFAADFFAPGSFYFADRLKPPSKNTVLIYNNNLKKYILPFFENYELGDINYLALKKFRMSLIEKEISFNTIKSIFGTLAIVINAAYRAGEIVANPLDKLEPLTAVKENKNKDSFTLEEVKIIYNAIAPEFQTLILILALTGLRISEAAGVSDDDIKTTSDGLLYIDLKKQFNRGEYIPLKTRVSRPVPITQEIKELFSDNWIKTESDKIYFYNEFKRVRAFIKDYQERNLTPHSLRHFFITSAKVFNIGDSKVEFIAGHSLKGISAVYTNFKVEDLREVTTWQNETLKKITE